jgi:hypothetical protein
MKILIYNYKAFNHSKKLETLWQEFLHLKHEDLSRNEYRGACADWFIGYLSAAGNKAS